MVGDGFGLKGAKINSLAKLSQEDFDAVEGGLPEPKGGFESLLRLDGDPIVAEITSNTQAVTHVKNNSAVPLSAGSRVALVAKNGDFVRVMIGIKQADGSTKVTEGFVKSGVLKVLGLVSQGNEIDIGGSSPGIEVKLESATISGSSENGGPTKPKSPDSETVEAQIDSRATQPGPAGVPAGAVQSDLGTVSHHASGGSCKSVVFKAALTPLGIRYLTCSTSSVNPSQEGERSGGGFCQIAGSVFRVPSETSSFQVQGEASRIRVTPAASDYGCTLQIPGICNGQVKKVYVPTVIDVDSAASSHVIPLTKILKERTDAQSGKRQFVFEMLDGKGGVTGKCTMLFVAASPIVLDLDDRNSFEGVELGDSKVRFDLLGYGEKKETGWIRPSMGLLALDRNGDGVITSGRELFGEGTLGQAGQRFSNGYLALAEFDTNQDGILDAKDPIFNKLLVWRDVNVDGVSQAGELASLASYGISALSLSYGPSLRHGVPQVGANDVRLESRYFGPKRCGSSGCLTFDVFFATAQIFASK